MHLLPYSAASAACAAGLADNFTARDLRKLASPGPATDMDMREPINYNATWPSRTPSLREVESGSRV
jgi:hypothetical protein